MIEDKETEEDLNTIKLSYHLPLDFIFPKSLASSKLTSTEQKIYLQLAIEFDLILSKAISYQDGIYSFEQIINDRLQHYGLTRDAWDYIASHGDQDKQLQIQFHKLTKKIYGILIPSRIDFGIKAST
ncbi:MAG: hypothetical protein EAX86_06515 [Candidatus Heimdallarchaeota archaeon]|nr:hypothetical protein [Candidatus Heimdallarchaeota archaeon]